MNMGLSFAAVSLLCMLAVLVLTRKYVSDSRQMVAAGNSVRGVIKDMREIVADPYPRYVFGFIIVVTVGISLVSSLQMYLYEHFMKFSGMEKSIVHGGSMIGFGIGSLVASSVSKRFDKKGTVFLAAILSIGSNVILAALFLPGVLVPGASTTLFSWTIPHGFLVFAFFHALYWSGNGVIFPTATSMMADVSELNGIRTGINKDGAYAAVYSFALTCAISLASLISGYSLTLIGFEPGKGILQGAETLWRLCAVTLLAGPLISLVSLGLSVSIRSLMNSSRQ
jgi:Na+/melibiose symporter-like transporter